MRPNRLRTTAAVGAALFAGAGAGVVGYSALDGDEAAPTSTSAPAGVTTTVVRPVANAAMSVNDIWRSAGPAVVEITVAGGTGRFPGGDAQSQGSGWVYDKRGHIVTNQHVVEMASTVRVRFQNGRTFTAEVVGTDPSTDLAVVKVDAPASVLQPLALADSGAIQIGEGVVAIGSPFGLEGTVTTGIVSALERQMQAPNGFTINGAIQTDAAINHGNSGGPLLDLAGKVVGVNAQIESESGGNDGVGFAIASNTVKNVVPQLISRGSVQHAFLGVSLAAGTPTIAEVRAGTPADEAGLQPGDVVLAIDGRQVTTSQALQTAIDAHKPGDEITLRVRRDGSERDVDVTLGTRPS